ncbi:FAD/NAD(P)-binding domain-containing protein [Annulohypoxylon maeteangense]|uniref:FAD/NAD(P)-binding domain-containing protein n=1 Tax=Annulohypoxylon maeteangense TaxID=1927788 RepID=UPI0020077E14|nr:FAD/NAD(P)-binding domain-containing protein [Annulohypoxylon maeteangense]KAI0879818.1 FAD/NAD(P)-binding domain-containing protein [Annulohypoxylon maeteangense]
MEEYDFIIVGAGLSGVDAAYRLKSQLPQCSYIILEAREEIGGTWSFFKFPGVRSDSELALLGLPWRPWTHENDMADADLIREYIEDAARAEGIDKKIHFGHRVTGASWSSDEQRWTLSVLAADVKKELNAKFLLACTGYYDYAKPLQADIPGMSNFQGTIAHPQFWPTDLDYAGKKVIIIGSGATAVTMVPVMAKTASQVTMLQRSPSYVMSLPLSSPVNVWLKKHLPGRIAHLINWWISLIMENLFVSFSINFPNQMRNIITKEMRALLPAKIDVDVHFNPKYDPWDQRVCMCPDGDFFKALHQDNCDIVTDRIRSVTEDGILTESGRKLEADIIVPATGLRLHLFGGIIPVVDGDPVNIGTSYCWRGTMLSGLPNAGTVTGYTTTSWTVGADASIKLLIDVWKRMAKIGATSVVPVHSHDDIHSSKPVVAHSSTYFVMAQSRFPRITGESPWYGRKNVFFDYFQLWFGSLTKGLKYTLASKKNE